MKVFISSVIQGYELFRKAARQAVKEVGQEPILAEDLGARPYSPRYACLNEVRECTIFIGIYGRRYGSETSSGMSICEEELEEAKRLNKKILIYVEGVEDFEPRQAIFIGRIRDYETGFFCDKFKTKAALRKKIMKDLGICLSEMIILPPEDSQHDNIKKYDYFMTRIPELVVSCDIPSKDFFINEDNELKSLVIIGNNIQDTASASLIEEKIRQIAVSYETKEVIEDRRCEFKSINIGDSINVTSENLESLWYFDSDQSSIFNIRNPHEEIIVRFDRIGINENDMPSEEEEHIGFYGICSKIFHIIPRNPGLLLKSSNIQIPNMLRVGKYKIPSLEYYDKTKKLPQFKLFEKYYNVVEVGKLFDSNFEQCGGNEEWFRNRLGAVITGNPRFYQDQYLYINDPVNYDGYEITIKDIDIHQQKVWIHTVNPSGDEHECWLRVNTSQGFPEDYIFMDIMQIAQTNEFGERKLLYEYPNFFSSIKEIFYGLKNNACAKLDIYTLNDIIEFYTSNAAYIEEPNSYMMGIECYENTFNIIFAPCQTLNIEKYMKNPFFGPNNYFKIYINEIHNNTLDFEIVKEFYVGTYTEATPLKLPEKITYLYNEIINAELDRFNIILIGTIETNPFILELNNYMKSPDDGSPPDWMLTSNGEYKIYTNPFDNGRDILVISGSNPENARLAAEDFVTKL